MTPDTIFALSSGAPPAAIGVIRISGPRAGAALLALAGRLPPPRRAALARLRDEAGDLLDEALVLWLPGPATETGEDIAELQCHGARAVIAALEAALARMPGLRRAGPGEFTRRAFANGKIDLAQAEGLAELLSAETELARRAAQALAGGALSRAVTGWREATLVLAAAVEATLDFADEDDVGGGLPGDFAVRLGALAGEIGDWLARPRAEALREGFKIVIAGPPNAGKSTLFNALLEDEAAIVTPMAGTTRDLLSAPVAIGGVPFRLIDTAGVRAEASDPVEEIGIARAREAAERADLVLWLGAEGEGPEGAWEIEPQIDRDEYPVKAAPRHRISAHTGAGLEALRADLIVGARAALPQPGTVALGERQHRLLSTAHEGLRAAQRESDALLIAEGLRVARAGFDALLGKAATEDMLDALFGRFCIGK